MLQTLDKGLPTAQSSLSLTVINARKISHIEHGIHHCYGVVG